MMFQFPLYRSQIAQKAVPDLLSLFKPWICFRKNFPRDLRQRIFTFKEIFWLFLFQVLSPQTSCKSILKKAMISFILTQHKNISMNTAAYCKARKRFPFKELRKIFFTLVKQMNAFPQKHLLWLGRSVTIVDGTTATMPDTPLNQKRFPQTSRQKPGCGFPIVRLVVLFSLSVGSILNYSLARYTVSEKTLFRRLFKNLSQGNVVLGDRFFCSFCDVWALMQRQIDVVMRIGKNQQCRFQIVKRLGKKDHLIHWLKPSVRPLWINPKVWAIIPDKLLLRRISYSLTIPGLRTEQISLVTSLIDHKKYPKKVFHDLYYRRWKAELFLRDIKTTMGMDILSCQSPDMVEKEILFHLLAYNLIRLIMFQSGKRYHVPLDRISFKGALQTIIYASLMFYSPFLTKGQRKKLRETVFFMTSQDLIYERPGRREPRAIKRRPKRFQLLTQPRSIFKEDPHRGK